MDQLSKSREQLTQELRLSEERFYTFMNNAPFVSFIKDKDRRMLYYNRKMAEQFHVTPHQWLGRNNFEIWPDEIARAIDDNDLEVISTGESIERLEETIDAQGRLTTWKVQKFCWRNERGEFFLGGIAHDLTEDLARERALAEANLQLQKLAAIDSLTGLANRRILNERLEYEFRLARRHKFPLSVVLLDIDNFKRRNDVFGHAAGDKALALLGQVITSTLRATDSAARYGGEEFVVLLPGADTVGARTFADRLRENMRNASWPNEPLTASFGTAAIESHVGSSGDLIALADRAMYEAKRAGKDRIIDHHELPTSD